MVPFPEFFIDLWFSIVTRKKVEDGFLGQNFYAQKVPAFYLNCCIRAFFFSYSLILLLSFSIWQNIGSFSLIRSPSFITSSFTGFQLDACSIYMRFSQSDGNFKVPSWIPAFGFFWWNIFEFLTVQFDQDCLMFGHDWWWLVHWILIIQFYLTIWHNAAFLLHGC